MLRIFTILFLYPRATLHKLLLKRVHNHIIILDLYGHKPGYELEKVGFT